MSGLNEDITVTLQHYLRFQLGREWYGVHIDRIIEVLNFMMLTELPSPRPDVVGMMRLRELVIPVIDLRTKFGLPDPTYSLSTPIIVVDIGSLPLGLVVDDVDSLVEIDPTQIAPHNGSASRYVSGLAKLPGTLLMLLDLGQLASDISLS